MAVKESSPFVCSSLFLPTETAKLQTVTTIDLLLVKIQNSDSSWDGYCDALAFESFSV